MGRKKAAKLAHKALHSPVYLPDFTVGEIVTAFGQTVGWQISKYNIPSVWQETEGEGITVGVLDTGTEMGHPDLSASLIVGRNTTNNTNNVEDDQGHGTFCSGIITANNNTQGIVGVAPKAKILVIKVLGADGTGSYETVLNGINYAIDQGVDVISMSLGGPDDVPALHNAVKRAYVANIPVICAAGNAGNVPVSFPARYAETISVGALTDRNLRAEFSQTGAMLDFMAPGVSIQSTYPTSRYEYLTGSSMSCPWVAAVVALMMAKHRKVGGATPLNTVEDVREHLKKTAIDLDVAGKDPLTGYGLVDVIKALAEIQPPPPPPETEPKPKPGEPPMPNFEELTIKFNNWVAGHATAITTRDEIQTQINDLQAQLDTKNVEIAAYDDKAAQISALLG